MNRVTLAQACLIAACAMPLWAMADSTLSGAAVQDSAQAVQHSGASAAHSVAASGRATLGVSAVPLSVGGAVLGSVGAVSTAAAHDSARAASAPAKIGQPLEVTDEAIMVMPPNEALKKPNKTLNP